MSDERYNGWANRETWGLVLHLNNDEGLQGEAHAVVREPGVWGRTAALESWVTDLLSSSYWTEEFGTPMPEWAHLMRADVGSLWRVDWAEAAESLYADAVEADGE